MEQPTVIVPLNITNMWTAKIINSEKSDLDINLTVEFTDGNITKTIPFRVSNPDSIKKIIKTQLDQYEKVGSAVIDLGPVDTNPVDLPPPTQGELDTIQFQKTLGQYRQSIRAESVGLVITPSSTDLLEILQSTFKPEYLTLFNI